MLHVSSCWPLLSNVGACSGVCPCRGVTLINDFEAQGRGITLLRQKPKLISKSIAEVAAEGLDAATDVVTLYMPKELKKEEPISAIKPNTKKVAGHQGSKGTHRCAQAASSPSW